MKEAGRFTKSEYQNSEMYDVVLPEATSGRRTAQNSRHSVAWWSDRNFVFLNLFETGNNLKPLKAEIINCLVSLFYG